MTAQTKPRNYLETILAARQAQERVAEIMNQQQQPRKIEEAAPPMKEVHINDRSGRTITQWEGRCSWMRDFESAPKKVVGIKTR